jgi:prevent-host-death family protein
MRTVSALEVRKKFGQLVDEAAAGERLIIERAGQPVAALVPLSDVPYLTREERIRTRLKAIEEIKQYAAAHPFPDADAPELIREQRRKRDAQLFQNIERDAARDA